MPAISLPKRFKPLISKPAVWILISLLLSCSLGIAGQNIILFFILMIWLKAILTRSSSTNQLEVSAILLIGLGVCISFVLAIGAATYLNSENPLGEGGFFRYPFGYVFWILGPYLCVRAQPRPRPEDWALLGICTSCLGLFWAFIAVTQAAWGWRVLGHEFILENHFRPRGFYSHPLSFAYVAFLFFPLACNWVARQSKNYWAWTLLVSLSVVIYLTASRTVQVVALTVLIWNSMRMMAQKRRVLLALALFGFLALAWNTPNNFSRRMKLTFSEEGLDRHSGYLDDRLAFWDVHWTMVKERPILGHGFGIDTSYREKYYNMLGLADFRKKYEAHNTFLQILTNGGIVAGILFITWIIILFVVSFKSRIDLVRKSSFQTLVAYLLISLTQNSFQDASVRASLSVLVAGLFLSVASQKQNTDVKIL